MLINEDLLVIIKSYKLVKRVSFFLYAIIYDQVVNLYMFNTFKNHNCLGFITRRTFAIAFAPVISHFLVHMQYFQNSITV